MTVTHTAWATTTASMPGTDPGIGIQAERRYGIGLAEPGDVVVYTVEDLGWGMGADGEFDGDIADKTLAGLGWERKGAWVSSGGQFAADVRRVRVRRA